MTGEHQFYRWAGLAWLVAMTIPHLAVQFGFFTDGLFCCFGVVGIFLAAAGLIKGGWGGRICAGLALFVFARPAFYFFHGH
jgi:hypothetical protein